MSDRSQETSPAHVMRGVIVGASIGMMASWIRAGQGVFSWASSAVDSPPPQNFPPTVCESAKD